MTRATIETVMKAYASKLDQCLELLQALPERDLELEETLPFAEKLEAQLGPSVSKEDIMIVLTEYFNNDECPGAMRHLNKSIEVLVAALV